MHAQVLQIALGDHLADGVGHRANAQLQAGAVGDLGHHQVGDGHIHLGGLAGAAQGLHGRILALHDHVYLADMDAVLKAAQADGHVLVDLHNDGLGAVADGLQVGAAGAEVEVTVFVHGSHLEHGHIQGLDAVAVIAGQLGIAQGDIIGEALLDGFPLNAGHMPGVPDKVVSGVGHIKNSGTACQNTAADLDVGQVSHPLGQGLVQRVGGADAPAVIQPVAGLDHLYGPIGGFQFLLIFFLIAHCTSSYIVIFYALIDRKLTLSRL